MTIRQSRLVTLAFLLASCDEAPAPSATPASTTPSATPASNAPAAEAGLAAPPPATPATPATPAGDPGFGEVAFKTYEASGMRIVFTTPAKARITWRNMAGKAVEGTYTQTGKELEIKWDPAAENIGSLSEKFRQMGPCSMARYERVDKAGKVHDASPKIYQQIKPRCDTVRVTQ